MSPTRRRRLTSSIVTDPTAELQDQIAGLLRAYERAPEADKTEILRDAAVAVVKLREQFLTPEGTPDWRGRSHAYRMAMAEVFSLAALAPGDGRRRLQAALAYHVSIVLHETLDEDTLEDLGLRDKSTRERSVEKRERQAAIIAAYRGPGVLPAVRSMEAAHKLLSAADDAALKELPATDRAVARRLAEGIIAEAERLSRAAGARRKG